MTAALAHAPEAPAVPAPEPLPVDIARRRHIFVHLTPFCPGRERLAITHAKRNKWFYSAPPLGVLKTVLAELRVMPAAAGGEIEVNGDLNITIPVRPELVGLISADPSAPAVGAIISDGLTLAEFEAARAALIAANWKPLTALELIG